MKEKIEGYGLSNNLVTLFIGDDVGSGAGQGQSL